MKIVLDDSLEKGIFIDGLNESIDFLDGVIDKLLLDMNVETTEYSIENSVARYVLKCGEFEYHVLEKPAGTHPLWYRHSSGSRTKINVTLPNTLLILKIKNENGKYICSTESLVHTKEPLNSTLSNECYAWALSNVYSSLKVCWGQELLPDFNPNTSFKILDEFFFGTKNNDLLTDKSLFRRWESVENKDSIVVRIENCTLLRRNVANLIELLKKQ